MITSKFIKLAVTAATIASLLFSSLAHARKLLRKQDPPPATPARLCLPSSQLSTPCVYLLDELEIEQQSIQDRNLSPAPATTPLAAILFWRSPRDHCHARQSSPRRRLIYTLFPQLPEMSLQLDNFSMQLDIDHDDGGSSFPLTLQIGYRSCW